MRRYRPRKRSTPGRILAVMNHKGGTAKSTSFELLAMIQSNKSGVAPLLVDFDPQMNLSSALRYRASVFPGNIGHVLEGWDNWDAAQIEANVCAVKYKGWRPPLHLVPGSLTLDAPLAALATTQSRDDEVVLRLRRALHHVRDFYEYILIDTSPAVSSLPGSLTLYAADVLLVPVSGLRSVLGLIEVLRRVKTHMRDRKAHEFLPLQVFIYAPHVLTDASAKPVGPYDVKNNDFYPYLCKTFPHHFVQQIVGHSIHLPRAFQTDISIRALGDKPRRQYRDLTEELFARIEAESTPFLGSMLANGSIDLDQMEEDVKGMISTEEEMFEIREVKYSGLGGH